MSRSIAHSPLAVGAAKQSNAYHDEAPVDVRQGAHGVGGGVAHVANFRTDARMVLSAGRICVESHTRCAKVSHTTR